MQAAAEIEKRLAFSYKLLAGQSVNRSTDQPFNYLVNFGLLKISIKFYAEVYNGYSWRCGHYS